MSTNPVDALLGQLTSGDSAVAEKAFLAYEPYLRMVVRRQLPARLRAKFDSVDVVQSVWADLFKGLSEARWQFPDAEHLRAFLVKVTRNRFIDHVRQYKQPLAREQPLARTPAHEIPASPDPRPSEVVRAEELWEQMVASCPPAHREVLRLKRQGFPLAEIAARTGLHPGSVRRILYDLARRMADRERKARIKDEL